jgi:regulator of protease activity HflC (stomatin/prohibitin superfamily)
MTDISQPESREIRTSALSGWFMLLVNLVLLFGGLALLIYQLAVVGPFDRSGWLIGLACLAQVLGIILLGGHFTLQPNEARVLILFGDYRGTVRESGFFWANPFYSRTRTGDIGIRVSQKRSTPVTGPSTKLSLRARNFNSDKLKVNDKRGNPVEIAAVIVWRVEDTAKAAFDVDNFESYVQIQSESAIRHIASLYAYDQSEDDEPTLRGSADEVAQALQAELEARLAKAGVTVDEARLTHLAYAPEIAQAMLRRQQAEAVIAARMKIVQGAVGMVDMALKELAATSVVHLDEERKAAMVSNLLVVLCGESEVSPVVNTGTLYS